MRVAMELVASDMQRAQSQISDELWEQIRAEQALAVQQALDTADDAALARLLQEETERTPGGDAEAERLTRQLLQEEEKRERELDAESLRLARELQEGDDKRREGRLASELKASERLARQLQGSERAPDRGALERSLQSGAVLDRKGYEPALEDDEALARALAEEDRQAEAKRAESLRLQEQENLLAVLSSLGLRSCPRCHRPWDVREVNCGVFMCGVTRQGQLAPHDEGSASQARERGDILVGCGGQFRLNGDQLAPVACSGQ